MALLFLDSQKAFNNVSWQFMILQLNIMDLGEKFIKVIKTIYKNQTTKIIINGEWTEDIKI